MNMELLPPDTLSIQLQEKLHQMKDVLASLSKAMRNQPEGHLRVAQKPGKNPQYYHYTSPENLTGKYIRKKQIEFAKTLAQKDYNEQIIQLLHKEISALEDYFSKGTCGESIYEFYNTLFAPRRKLITPVTLTNEQYAIEWKKVTWIGRPFAADGSEFYTTRGERVRSKSELLIAEALAHNNIPFRYEFPLQLLRTSGNAVTLYPDFLCLNVHTRTEFYWEHFGLMDSPEYANNAAGKLRLYTENGILAGRNLIITMETQASPLSTRLVNKLIEAYLI